MQAVRTIGDWKPALEYVKSSDPALRAAVVLALTDVYDADAVKALGQVAANSADPETQAAAVEALGEVCRESDHYAPKEVGGARSRSGKPARPRFTIGRERPTCGGIARR